MLFGMVNSTATFNRMMRKLLDNIQNSDSFVDDLLARTQTWYKHMQVLRELFSRIRKLNKPVAFWGLIRGSRFQMPDLAGEGEGNAPQTT